MLFVWDLGVTSEGMMKCSAVTRNPAVVTAVTAVAAVAAVTADLEKTNSMNSVEFNYFFDFPQNLLIFPQNLDP